MRSTGFIVTVFTTMMLNGHITNALPLERRAQEESKIGGSGNVVRQVERSVDTEISNILARHALARRHFERAAAAEFAALMKREVTLSNAQFQAIMTKLDALEKASAKTGQAKFNDFMTTLGGSVVLTGIGAGTFIVAFNSLSHVSTVRVEELR